ncbi:MAG: hypothetical protein A3J83_03205 [Elusimicrobia bacterium RIFOXYA2_FULL_40_6]|nr:MAG: hypothetical protein A3J83_03205 [Elusimicrobia bacterium RIFOXYA2_FULL_40_6]
MYIKQEKNIAWRVIEGKAYLVNTKTSYLHSLDEVGTSAWRHISGGTEFEKLLDKLAGEFEVKRTILHKDITEFIEELETKGLIEVCGG